MASENGSQVKIIRRSQWMENLKEEATRKMQDEMNTDSEFMQRRGKTEQRLKWGRGN